MDSAKTKKQLRDEFFAHAAAVGPFDGTILAAGRPRPAASDERVGSTTKTKLAPMKIKVARATKAESGAPAGGTKRYAKAASKVTRATDGKTSPGRGPSTRRG